MATGSVQLIVLHHSFLQFCCGLCGVSFDIPVSWPREFEDYELNVQAEF